MTLDQFNLHILIIQKGFEELIEYANIMEENDIEADSMFENLTAALYNNLHLLEYIYEDEEGAIGFFIFDLAFGAAYSSKKVWTDSGGVKWHFKSVEDLYEYLND